MQLQNPINPERFQSTHSRWLALTQRAPSSHSSFLYGVKSTKIYCRPTCSARLARRANVVFYDTVEQARRDGFRPCKRCEPDNPGFVGESEEVVTRVLTLLQRREGKKWGLKALAIEVGVSPSYLCRVFKKTMGVTVGAYMMEFGRGENKEESGVFSQCGHDQHGLGVVDAGTEVLVPEIIKSPGDDVVNFENFNLDDWVWTESLLNDTLE
ncbi:metal binding domain of Ada-domain-containing protein [Aspergillus avenaceus]|uniref:Metal binding domain of Ada-domain-containing protein n=1 Tax=Aspergillus avenaceus TaxID=36643 RepID=A0A5N6U253_ASPAV|nr:metal binding domain of Ada-domain-containing protein [Aspergillus avenaceus]